MFKGWKVFKITLADGSQRLVAAKTMELVAHAYGAEITSINAGRWVYSFKPLPPSEITPDPKSSVFSVKILGFIELLYVRATYGGVLRAVSRSWWGRWASRAELVGELHAVVNLSATVTVSDDDE